MRPTIQGSCKKARLLGEPSGGVGDDGGHAAKVGAADEEGPAAHAQLQVAQLLLGRLWVQTRVWLRISPQRRLHQPDSQAQGKAWTDRTRLAQLCQAHMCTWQLLCPGACMAVQETHVVLASICRLGAAVHLDGVQQLLAGEALLNAAVQLAHQALAHAHVQHDVAIAHVQALH